MVPTVQISSAPAGGLTAVGIASMIGGIQVCNLNSNPRLQYYLRLNGRLTTYKLKKAATSNGSSHYSLFQLIKTGYKLLEAAIKLRNN
jgi:hypothetical protein